MKDTKLMLADAYVLYKFTGEPKYYRDIQRLSAKYHEEIGDPATSLAYYRQLLHLVWCDYRRHPTRSNKERVLETTGAIYRLDDRWREAYYYAHK